MSWGLTLACIGALSCALVLMALGAMIIVVWWDDIAQ